MLKIKSYIKESPGMGYGLFADQFIPKDTIIWEYIEGFDICVHESKVQNLNDIQKQFVNKYFWKEGEYLYGSCDHDNFINHSLEPNCIEIKNGSMIACKDIQKDEEILVNYGEFDDDYPLYKDTFTV